MVARTEEKLSIAAMWRTRSCHSGEVSQRLGRFEVNPSRIERANEVRPEDAAVDQGFELSEIEDAQSMSVLEGGDPSENCAP